jgi:hypothetical protein
MSRPQTRAEWLGIQPGRLTAKTRRKLDRIMLLLEEISADWSEADSAVDFDCSMLRDEVEKFRTGTLAEATELLREPFIDG